MNPRVYCFFSVALQKFGCLWEMVSSAKNGKANTKLSSFH